MLLFWSPIPHLPTARKLCPKLLHVNHTFDLHVLHFDRNRKVCQTPVQTQLALKSCTQAVLLYTKTLEQCPGQSPKWQH